MSWEVAAAGNLVVAAAYLAIAWIIASGLIKTRQLKTNRLGLATALIFFTCSVSHGMHAVHMLLPFVGVEEASGLAMRAAFDTHQAVWSVLTAGVGLYYLSLRHSYASVLRGAQMFEDLRARQQQAMEINDQIVQGLTVAQYALESGATGEGREAIERTLIRSREIITDLLGETDGELGPGALRRKAPAKVR